MIPTIHEFLERRTVPGKGVTLYVLRSVCARWSRERGGPFIEAGTLEDVVRQRGARIGLRADGKPQVFGITLLPADAPDNYVPNAAGAAEAMRRIAGGR
ncbi:hypothetical protein ROS62_04950 [Streptomyces sp. DSM 41972]|uniref:Uncharacterized protein n=1 Tax=Streptomyces althioticus subsp. attaecolombicae TaxID=3075534 RepID=A0ABU3HU86_9ACTN|nr:hypothetical protein [Streptomyces sp. DSM 41972]